MRQLADAMNSSTTRPRSLHLSGTSVAQFWVCPTVIWDRLTGDWGPGPTNFFLRNLGTPFYGHTIWRTWGFKLSHHGMEWGSKFWKPKWVLKKITLQWSQGSNNKQNMWKNHAFALCGTPTTRRKDNSSWVGLRTYCSGDYWYHLRSFEADALFGWLVANYLIFPSTIRSKWCWIVPHQTRNIFLASEHWSQLQNRRFTQQYWDILRSQGYIMIYHQPKVAVIPRVLLVKPPGFRKHRLHSQFSQCSPTISVVNYYYYYYYYYCYISYYYYYSY